ncbi:hypothetical protein G169_gp58 [Pseudomonas phage AF]|uniref:hypothetical protein n=1 Tax=Pseudomonas phage AF TaxID=1235689 RepID=UPI0002971F07|nr:hypothetical protein G169_gp58 [Pseudomonas phage AF]AFV50671.1 hypothetical protein AF_058 [Pseudomonas phage AF]
MSKPDWKDAPEGFEYLAQDKDGEWYWWISEPFADTNLGYWMSDFKNNDCRDAGLVEPEPNPDWQETLERRP